MTIRMAGVALALCAGAVVFAAHAQQGRPLDFASYQIKTTKLADNLYVAEAAPGVGNVVFLTGPDGVLLVDSMFPQLHDKLIAAIHATGATGPIRYVVNTHLHNDHTAGNTLMAKDGATVVAQENVLTRMKTAKRQDGSAAYPQTDWPKETYADRMTLHFDGEDIELIHSPAAHTDGDTLVFFKHANVMAEGDLPGSIRFNNIGVDDITLEHRWSERNKIGWKPKDARPRKVSTALKAYAHFATSAAKGAVRVVD